MFVAVMKGGTTEIKGVIYRIPSSLIADTGL